VRGMDYIGKRVAFALVTLFVAISLNFVLFRAIPGNAVSSLRCRNCTQQLRNALTKQYGLDKSKWEQYVLYLKGISHGDLGTSTEDGRPVWQDIKQPLVNTLPMIVAGTLISIVLGVLAGVIAAWRRGTLWDHSNTWVALAFYAAPTQWIGLLIVFYIALPLGLPAAGIESNTLGVFGNPSTWEIVRDRFDHLLLPALTLGVGLYGEYALIVRSSMLETLGEDYVLTARAKGLRNWAIVWRHALQNAMLPLVTLIALSFGYILAGAIVVEYVFSYPGIGLATIQAIDRRDYPVLQGLFLILTIGVIAANLIADLLYFKLDPRVTT
jgi:ABC-type dipeptide/oligopeptide/nickel transport system permease component